jgi:hypothetical protein
VTRHVRGVRIVRGTESTANWASLGPPREQTRYEVLPYVHAAIHYSQGWSMYGLREVCLEGHTGQLNFGPRNKPVSRRGVQLKNRGSGHA